MTVPASIQALNQVLENALGLCQQAKSQAGNAIVSLQAGNVTSDFFLLPGSGALDQLRSVVSSLAIYSATPGLNAFATASLPGYAGTLTTDLSATSTASTNAINWVVANFPTNGGSPAYLLAYVLNADGSRTPRSFTPSNTAPFVTLLQALIATIG